MLIFTGLKQLYTMHKHLQSEVWALSVHKLYYYKLCIKNNYQQLV